MGIVMAVELNTDRLIETWEPVPVTPLMSEDEDVLSCEEIRDAQAEVEMAELRLLVAEQELVWAKDRWRQKVAVQAGLDRIMRLWDA